MSAGNDAQGGVARWMRALMNRALPRERRSEMLSEMDDLFARKVSKSGRVSAHAWYLQHTLGFGVVRAVTAIGAAFGWLARSVGVLARDVRMSARILRRRPGYSATSAITLGIGIGGVVAVFSVANWVMLRPVPGVPNGDQLTTVRLEIHEGGSTHSFAFPVSNLDLGSLQEMSPSIEALEASAQSEVNVIWGAGIEPDRRTASVVTPGFFELLEMRPVVGRFPGPGDLDPTRIAVISHEMWQRHFDGQVSAIGAEVRINGHPHELIGVAPPGFRGAELPGSADLWVPASVGGHILDLPESFLERRDLGVWTDMVARLSPGADPVRMSDEGTVAMDRVRNEIGYPHSFLANFTLAGYPGLGISPWVRPGVERTLRLLSAAALALLLLAVFNAANLSLTHSTGSASNVAVHTALGAGRVRLIMKGVIQHVLLGLLSAAVGLAVAAGGVALFREGSISTLGASLEGLGMDGSVFLFTGLVAIAAGVLAGIGPTITQSRVRVAETLQGHRFSSRRVISAQNGLVILQVALSTILLISSGLLARTALNLRNTDLGFDPDSAVRFSFDPGAENLSQVEEAEVADRVLAQMRDAPGVQYAGLVAPSPVQPSYYTTAYLPMGGNRETDLVLGGQLQATEGFLSAFGVRLIAGRLHERRDRVLTGNAAGATPVVVSRSFAEQLFPDLPVESAVGRMIVPGYEEGEAEIVGVIEELRVSTFVGNTHPLMILPWGSSRPGTMTAWVRTVQPPSAMLVPVRAAARTAIPGLPVFGLQTGRAQVDGLMVENRILARLGLSIAMLGLVLASLGLYGMLSYLVVLRRKEIGIRMALGASNGAIRGSVTRRAGALTLVGLVAGGLGTIPASRLIGTRLHGVAALDPATYAVVGAGLLLTAWLAASIPAWRSTRIDAREALTSE